MGFADSYSGQTDRAGRLDTGAAGHSSPAVTRKVYAAVMDWVVEAVVDTAQVPVQQRPLLPRRCGPVLAGRVSGVGAVAGVVREWWDEQGWGVIDSIETPEGCWTHFSHINVPGFRTLSVGQQVRLEWEPADQDGYLFRAVSVGPNLS